MGVVPGRIRTGFGLARIARRFVGPQLPGPLALIRPQQRARWSVCYHRFPRGGRGWFWTLDDQCTKTLLRSGLARRLCAGGAKSRGSCALNWRSSAAATSRSKSESPSTERTSAPERSRHEFRCCAFDYELAPRPVLTWCWARIRIRNSPCTGRFPRAKLDDGLLKHVAPVHWNHINLTGDYSWRQNKVARKMGV
jgi:hypothetical protein